jgi:Uma2 family endonuclease
MATAEPRDPAPVTLEYFARLPEDNRWKVEAVRGRLVREPRPAPLHNRVQGRLHLVLGTYEREQHARGVVLLETEFVLSLDPLTVRVPDVAWVAAGRIPGNGYALPRWHLAPDLAAEVVSPRNTRAELEERVADFLAAGSRLVWIVDPHRRSVEVHRPGEERRRLGVMDELGANDVLPGFRVPVCELFPE